VEQVWSKERERGREVGVSVLEKIKMPPSIDPGGFLGGRRRDFRIVTLERSIGRGVVELVTGRGKGDKGLDERVKGDLKIVGGEGLYGGFEERGRVLRGGTSTSKEGEEMDEIGSQEGKFQGVCSRRGKKSLRSVNLVRGLCRDQRKRRGVTDNRDYNVEIRAK
jgi:hypothetical protein